MRHSQREKLMVDDINHALRVQNVEVKIYSFYLRLTDFYLSLYMVLTDLTI
jgi:hypothetical protein